jgi:S-adenosylmethionine:tRNA ribosyltransferase-isomerase
MVVNRATGSVEHRSFSSFPTLAQPGDVLVINVSRVMKARLRGVRENGREAEILLTSMTDDGTWLAMVHPGGKLKVGRKVQFGDDSVAEVVEVVGGGLRRIRLSGSLTGAELMQRYGSVPLPPYINRTPEVSDEVSYQTVYAREDGSVAAPTAGLHFTERILAQLREHGVLTAEVLLHIGPGTFKPVEADDPGNHRMHSEWYSVSEEAAGLVGRARQNGNRVWAVGTTSARVLEALGASGGVRASSGWTDLFIRPPYQFQIVDALLTNFHLPRSTLLMLVAAFAGYDTVMNSYREAIARGYRLYSYGDAMAIV